MPYIPALDEDTVAAVGKFLCSVTLRPRETNHDEDVLRLDRKSLWATFRDEIPVTRREDFYAALRDLAMGDLDDAVKIIDGPARKVHLLLSCYVDDFEPLFYDDVDEIDDDVCREILAAQGYDVASLLLDADRIMPRQPVRHDPDVPRCCSRCKETKPTTEFGRRAPEGEPGYFRFQALCIDCKTDYAREWRAKHPGYDTRTGRKRRAAVPVPPVRSTDDDY